MLEKQTFLMNVENAFVITGHLLRGADKNAFARGNQITVLN